MVTWLPPADNRLISYAITFFFLTTLQPNKIPRLSRRIQNPSESIAGMVGSGVCVGVGVGVENTGVSIWVGVVVGVAGVPDGVAVGVGVPGISS